MKYLSRILIHPDYLPENHSADNFCLQQQQQQNFVLTF